MTEKQKQETEEKIWNFLRGYEHIFTTVQPTLTYSIASNKFCMKNALLIKLPKDLKEELLTILDVCN